ncbi:hypothetical protein EU534_01365 [Candidatus Heimdallarchaeota archaeon]|nr:MAG: hypothetical protein EU534_01365 [Candidatus Heimdallarchaeota archaeon]
MSMNRQEDSLKPVFLNVSMPYLVISIQDKLIHLEEIMDNPCFLDAAIQLLFDLFHNQLTAKQMPKQLQSYFQTESFKHNDEKCLIGEFSSFGSKYRCLLLSMEIVDEKKVILRDFQFNDTSLDFCIEMSPIDFFHILSNLIVGGVSHLCDSMSELEYFREKRLNKFQVNNFITDYLDYVYNCLISKKMTILDLLRFGGISSLIFLLDQKKEVIENIKELLTDIENLKRFLKYDKMLLFVLIETLEHAFFEPKLQDDGSVKLVIKGNLSEDEFDSHQDTLITIKKEFYSILVLFFSNILDYRRNLEKQII